MMDKKYAQIIVINKDTHIASRPQKAKQHPNPLIHIHKPNSDTNPQTREIANIYLTDLT